VEGPVYIKKYTKSPVSGSSVATALAAGMASLALTLVRIRNSRKDNNSNSNNNTNDIRSRGADKSREDESYWRRFQDKKVILKIFQLMRDKKQKSLQPEQLFNDMFIGTISTNPLPEWTESLRSEKFTDMSDIEDDEGEESSEAW
jgi:hypothetical protein